MPAQDPRTPVPGDSPASSPQAAGRRRRAISERARLGGAEGERRRSGRPFVVSVLVHLAVVVVVVQLLTFGHGLRWLDPFASEDKTEERLTYVEPKAPDEPKQVAAAPVVPPVRPQPQPAAPVSGPVLGPVVPSLPPAVTPRDTGGGAARPGAPGIGEGDPNLRGARPGYGDPRVWAPPAAGGGGNGTGERRSGADRLDSVIASVLTQAADSLDSIARANGGYGRKPGDWTRTDKNGDKWGWDNAGIRLGKVTIPNALLSLLPLNAQVGMSGNPTEIANDRRIALARADIQRNMTMGPGDAQFRQLANELRDRRERERRARLRAPSADIVTAPVTKASDKNEKK